MGAPLGSLAGLAFGGVVASLWGWRAALVLASLPGILLAVIAFFTLVEPRRFQAAESAAEHSKAQPFWQALTGLLRNAAYMRLTIANAARSEEHTSELQSLMRISYAVFCLKKKKKTTY